MESIEKGIHNIDLNTKKLIEKQCCNIFSDIDSMGVDEQQAFNPHTVIEFREGKSHQVVESWNKTYGLLPNRKVMGNYYVDKIKKNELDENTSKKMYYVPEANLKSETLNNTSNNRIQLVKDFSDNTNPHYYYFPKTNYNLHGAYHKISFIE